MDPAQFKRFLENVVFSQAEITFDPKMSVMTIFKNAILASFDTMMEPLIDLSEEEEPTIAVSGITLTKQIVETMDIKILRPLIEQYYIENTLLAKPKNYSRELFLKNIWGIDKPKYIPRTVNIDGTDISPKEALQLFNNNKGLFKHFVDHYYEERPEIPRYGGYRESGYWPEMQLKEIWHISEPVIEAIQKKTERKCRTTKTN